MSTYAVSEIEYWGMVPRIKMHYLGTDRDKAIEVFEDKFKLNTWNYDKKRFYCLPKKVALELGNHPKFEKVALYLIRECDDNGKVEIGSDWDDGEGDYPIYLQFTKSED
jgi:hypothetical protein